MDVAIHSVPRHIKKGLKNLFMEKELAMMLMD